MTNCPNCSGLLKPDSCRCEFCDTYFFDFCGIDFEEKKPFYMHIKTNRGIATMKVLPSIGEVEIKSDPIYVTGGINQTRLAMYDRRSASLHIDFDCMAIDDDGTLCKFEVIDNG